MAAAIYFHPHGCASGDGVVTLVSPGSLGSGVCAFNDGAFPNSSPAGGYEVRTLEFFHNAASKSLTRHDF